MTEPTTEAGRRFVALESGADPHTNEVWLKRILAIEAEARASLDDPLMRAALKFYADQFPAYAAAVIRDRDEYAAVMVDVNRVRAILAETER